VFGAFHLSLTGAIDLSLPYRSHHAPISLQYDALNIIDNLQRSTSYERSSKCTL